MFTVSCEENGCKEGYYNVDGLCNECIKASEHCTKCSYIAPSSSQEKIFKCLDCEGGIEGIYRVWKIDNKCHLCDGVIPYCIKCHYEKGTYKIICDECENNYYVDPNTKAQCIKCNRRDISGGNCNFCPDKQDCYCYSNYALKNLIECVSCPSNCYSCDYNQNTGLTCDSCNSGYSFDSNKVCSFCGNNCYRCSFDQSNIPTCNSCLGGYRLVEHICYPCPPNCYTCIATRYGSSNQAKCTLCDSYYVLNSNNQCINCPSNCPSCHFNR